MNINAWPFLVSRTKYVDYQPVVTPSFLQGRAAFLLAEAAVGEKTEPGYAWYREIHGPQSRNVSLIFRIVEAGTDFIHAQPGRRLRDEEGRPILLIEGLVLLQGSSKMFVLSSDFAMVRQQIQKAYANFWHTSDAVFEAVPSQSIMLSTHRAEGGKAIRLKTLSPFITRYPFDLPEPPFSIWATLVRLLRRVFLREAFLP